MPGTTHKRTAWAISLLAMAWAGTCRGGFQTRPDPGADWPQWLGPNRNGISTETPTAPLAQVPRLVWKNAVGVGVSSVVVSQRRAFTMGHVRGPRDRGIDTVYCFDADTGAVLWTHSYDCLSCRSQDVRFYGPRSTPTVDGDRVFTLSLEGHLFCLAANSGEVLWFRDLVRDLHGRIPVYGYCCSPLVYGDSLILELNAPDASYVALDKTSGEVLWRRAGGNVTCGSPVLTRIDDVDCAVFMGGGTVVGLNARTGEPLWRHGTWGHAWMGPVVSGRDIFVANASQPRGCGLIRLVGGKPTVVWEDRAKRFQTLHCNSVIWQGHIYGFDNTGTDYQGKDTRKSSLKCIELDTGRVKWTKSEMGWGNLIVHDGKLIILREAGELVVARASPEAYDELARAAVFGGQSWTIPAIADDRLYCRNNAGEVVCLRLFGVSSETVKPTIRVETTAQPRAPQQVPIEAQVEIRTVQPQAAGQDQWPRFRGPGGLGVVTQGLAASPEEVLWKSRVPLDGESSPIVWDERIFLTGANKAKREVYCFAAQDGRLLWQREISVPDANAPGTPDRDILLAAPTPVTDGSSVYAIFGNGDVACLDFEGEVKWSRNLGMPLDDYGHASSLELGDNLLFVQLDQGQVEDGKSKLLALAADCGRTVWEAPRPVPCSWSSPILVNVGHQAQLVTCAEPWLIAYEPATGREIWRANCLSGQIVPSPVYANGLLYVVSPDGKLVALRPDGSGDVTNTHVAWSAEEGLPSICCPVCNGELLWLVDSGGVVTCYDAKNEQMVWQHDLGAGCQASPTIIGDRLYILGDNGTLFVLEAGRRFVLQDRIELGEACQASPAVHEGRLFLRTKHHLVCLGGPAKQ
jgi:outer membrane protein assembly factor BamB